MDAPQIITVDPSAADVGGLLAQHHAFVNLHSPPEEVFALDLAGLLDPSVTVFGLYDDGKLLGIGALKALGDGHGELKSMHTTSAARGRGVARALVDHIIALAAERGYDRLSLETGAMEVFAPARAVYAAKGFERCGPFSDYPDNPNSHFMTRAIRS